MGSCHTADMHRQPAPAQCHIPPHLFPLVAAVPEQQGLWAEHLARKSAQQGGIPSVWSSSSLAPGLWQGNGFGACLHESGMQPQINSENRIQYRALVSVGRRGLTPQRCLNSPAGAAGGVAPLGCGAPSPAAQALGTLHWGGALFEGKGRLKNGQRGSLVNMMDETASWQQEMQRQGRFKHTSAHRAP